jgi:hypothetical protein
MSAELSVKSYPPKGIEVVPITFGAGLYAYFLLCLVPVAATIWFVVMLRSISPIPYWAWLGLIISVAGFFWVLGLLRNLKLEIRMDGISYTGFSRKARFVAYPDISSIVLIDYRQSDSYATPQRSMLSWTAIITPRVETHEPPIKIRLTFFPYLAYKEFARLFKPEVWEPGT